MNIFKKLSILSTLLIGCVGIQTIFAQPATWNGTADTDWYSASENAFTITTAEQLAGLALQPDLSSGLR
ncbi:MAG: hypothetical protein FWC26_01545 [Fibromonadales bacterium]|nr:hypothetical protein [Fibromonadales bacterium]